MGPQDPEARLCNYAAQRATPPSLVIASKTCVSFAIIVSDGEYEDCAIARGLAWSDAWNFQQFFAGSGTSERHLDQNGVMENDESRLLLFSRNFEPFGLEGGEQAVLPRRQCRGFRYGFRWFECAVRR